MSDRHEPWPRDPDRPREAIVVRIFRAALHLAPREFRLRDGEGVTHLFTEVHGEYRRRFGLPGSALAMIVELPGLIRLIIAAWRDARRVRARAARVHQPKASMLESLAHDLRSAARFMRAAPGIAAIAVLTLALGVGANTAMFSLVHGVLLKPLDMPRPGQLVMIGESRPNSPPGTLNATSPATFLEWKSSAPAASGMAAYTGRLASVTGFGEPEPIVAIPSAGGLLEVIGVRPLFGRLLLPSDEQPDAQPVVVLGYRLWQQLFGEDHSIIGRGLTVSGVLVTIVGVMPPGFDFPDANVGLWEPLRWTPAERSNRDQYGLTVVARVRDGATIEQLRAELAVAAGRLRRDWSQFNTDLVVNTVPLRDALVGGSRPQLLLLMGAVVFILLITCANLANLLLARATARRHEVAVRRALGARAGRIVRQLLAESLLLAVAGGLAAIAVGKVLMRFFLSALGDSLPRVDEVTLNGTVLAFTLAVAVVAGVAFGLAPALQLSRAHASEALRDAARTSGGRKTGRQALVVLQLALALMLMAGAGLLLRSFAYLGSVDPGFDPRRLLTLRFAVPNGRPDLLPSMLQRIGALPGVAGVAVTNQLPVTGRGIGAWFNMYSRPWPAGQTPPGEAYRVVSPGFFETAGIPLVRGRLAGEGDGLGGTPSVVVNEALVRKFWPGGDALGEEIYLGAPDNRLFDRATIIGVVGDTREAGLGADPVPVVYATTSLMPWWRPFLLMVRTERDPMAMLPAVRREIRALAPDLVLRDVETMEGRLRASLASSRWSLILIAAFAGLALIMASLGVFGVLSYLVAQRARELGIRVALGAAPARLRRMVVGHGLRLAGIGVVIGLAGALALHRTIRTMLFGVQGTDPATYAAVTVILIAVGALASWIPARRSTRVDPVKALREG